jgi:pyruvate kinase
MNSNFLRTKIIATLGPASWDIETIEKMLLAGTNVFRLNFAHTSYEKADEVVKIVREVSLKNNKPCALLADLQVPKLRIGEIKDGVILENDADVYITNEEILGDANRFTLKYENFTDFREGDQVLIDDGKIVLSIEKVLSAKEMKAKVIRGGPLLSRKGFNVPNANLSIFPITEKDKEDLKFIASHDFDWVALSFIKSAQDILKFRHFLESLESDLSIIAKIEKPEALRQLNEIIIAADGVMIARGDLGVEMPIYQLPVWQKRIITRARQLAKPVIVATQLLRSMIDDIIPSRAEVTDIANAVLDGADALLLTDETGIGKHPVLVVETMAKVIGEVEKNPEFTKFLTKNFKMASPLKLNCNRIQYVTASIATEVVLRYPISAIIGLTYTGSSIIQMSSYRSPVPIYAFTSQEKVIRKLCLIWGVAPFNYDNQNSTDESIEDTLNYLKENNFLRVGDWVIHTASMPIKASKHINTVKISIVE